MTKDDIRFVPLSIFLGVDDSLAIIDTLAPGEGLRRDRARAPWQRWTPPATPAPIAHHEPAFLCSHVFRNERPVLLVIRTASDWQLLCGDLHTDGPHLVGLSHLLERDESLLELLDLPPFWEAEREAVTAAWRRREPSAEERRQLDDDSD